ncbi:MAG TPA: peptidylprolyl isomerase [Bryobacteraceae bacterium]|nr:peptidylprolyl isomerase [Bryobacteraceae bacterium]
MKLLAPFVVLGCGYVFAADIGTVEEIIAKCNGDIITRGDIERSRKELSDGLRHEGLSGIPFQTAFAEREKNLLRDRIDQLLLVQKGKDLDIKVDTEISKRLAGIQKDSGIGDPEKFQAYVKEQTGMSFEDFKQEMRNDLMRQHVIRQEVGSKVNIKHDEIEKYYNEHKTEFVREERMYLREILVSTEKKDAAGIAAAEKKAKDLVSRARKGERFPEMARDNSDAVTAKGYGELPPFKKGELNKILEDQVWSQPKGYVTDPIRIDAGFEILRVEEHQKAGQADLADVENEITEKLYEPQMAPKVREYLTSLRQAAFLEIKADWVDTGAAPGKDTAWMDPAQLKPETTTKAEVAAQSKHKKLLWAIPIPGTKTKTTSTSH